MQYKDGVNELVHERIPFTALSDEHAEEKKYNVFKNIQRKYKHTLSGEGTKISNFELGGHYQQKRGRSFQFLLSPDEGHGREISPDTPTKTKVTPFKWFLGGKMTERIPTQRINDPNFLKPQLVTVHHRSKKEAEKIAKDTYRQNNKYPATTPIKVHGSHWV